MFVETAVGHNNTFIYIYTHTHLFYKSLQTIIFYLQNG